MSSILGTLVNWIYTTYIVRYLLLMLINGFILYIFQMVFSQNSDLGDSIKTSFMVSLLIFVTPFLLFIPILGWLMIPIVIIFLIPNVIRKNLHVGYFNAIIIITLVLTVDIIFAPFFAVNIFGPVQGEIDNVFRGVIIEKIFG